MVESDPENAESLLKGGGVMETMAEFFEWINGLLGVRDQKELVLHPVFIGLCVVLFLYSLIKGWKSFYLTIAGLLGIVVIGHYFYPADTSELQAVLKFLGLVGALCLVLIYLGFVRE